MAAQKLKSSGLWAGLWAAPLGSSFFNNIIYLYTIKPINPLIIIIIINIIK